MDISAVAIEKMKQKYATIAPELKWEVGDVLDMKNFQDGSFNVVFDKAVADTILFRSGKKTADSFLIQMFKEGL